MGPYHYEPDDREPTKLNDPSSENPSSSSDSIILTNSADPPSDGGESSWIENGETDIDLDETKDSKKINKKKEESEHVETIHPEIHRHSNAHISNKDRKKKASKLVQDPKVVNLKKREKQTKEENIHAQRNEELLSVKKKDIERIYEQKNYAYLRPEAMKNLRFVSKPIPEDTDPDTSSDQKSGEKKP
ncbi:uncharacterized protein LOC122538091 [Frieseomelitta varia]|uniref:uncharacterized protein LOC122538091 n=1 Tax=Frieseomelitta varia TaxID=561572 RepID=UPI001CB6A6EA|nr:uncharacterized protein LOC122538091 [Frieseomelitta varia]